MIALNKILLTLLAIGLFVFSMAVAAGSFFSENRMIYIFGLVFVIFFQSMNYYFDFFFDGVMDVREKKWPKVVFLGLAILVVTTALLSAWSQAREYSDFLKLPIPELAISLFLLWYGNAVFFSSFFMGKEVAIFIYNPMAWFWWKMRRMKSDRMD